MVNIGLRVLARPNAASLPSMYRKLGLDYDDRVLPSIMNEVNKLLISFAKHFAIIFSNVIIFLLNLITRLSTFTCLINIVFIISCIK